VNKYFGSRYEAAAIVELCEKLPSFKSLVKRKTDEQFLLLTQISLMIGRF
jgi:hypothetical protein